MTLLALTKALQSGSGKFLRLCQTPLLYNDIDNSSIKYLDLNIDINLLTTTITCTLGKYNYKGPIQNSKKEKELKTW